MADPLLGLPRKDFIAAFVDLTLKEFVAVLSDQELSMLGLPAFDQCELFVEILTAKGAA